MVTRRKQYGHVTRRTAGVGQWQAGSPTVSHVSGGLCHQCHMGWYRWWRDCHQLSHGPARAVSAVSHGLEVVRLSSTVTRHGESCVSSVTWAGSGGGEIVINCHTARRAVSPIVTTLRIVSPTTIHGDGPVSPLSDGRCPALFPTSRSWSLFLTAYL